MPEISRHQKQYLLQYKKEKRLIFTARILLFVLFMGLWEMSARCGWIDSFIFSSPSLIGKTFLSMCRDQSLFSHIGVTLTETLVSFFFVVILGVGTAILLWCSPKTSRILEPYLVVLNSLPKSALAPLLIVWLGANERTIVVAGMSVAIFGSVINLYSGFCQADPEKLKYWMPVDWYNGGMEHTTLHLLYSRFWHRFLYDEGVVPCPEPYQKRTSHGMILGSNGEKMSKSRGNVVNPDDIVREYGADTLRTYEMFIGAFDLSASWSEDGVKGCRRFLERVWKLQDILTDDEGYSADMETKMHQTIKKVSSDFESLKYNTAIAAMMSLINDFYKKNAVTKGEFKTLLTLLNPVAPHITEELWQANGFDGRLYQTSWPEYDEEKTVESTIELAVQINGKMKGTLKVSKDEQKDNILAMAKEMLGDKLTGTIVKEIYVPGRIVNIVVKP